MTRRRLVTVCHTVRVAVAAAQRFGGGSWVNFHLAPALPSPFEIVEISTGAGRGITSLKSEGTLTKVRTITRTASSGRPIKLNRRALAAGATKATSSIKIIMMMPKFSQ